MAQNDLNIVDWVIKPQQYQNKLSALMTGSDTLILVLVSNWSGKVFCFCFVVLGFCWECGSLCMCV